MLIEATHAPILTAQFCSVGTNGQQNGQTAWNKSLVIRNKTRFHRLDVFPALVAQIAASLILALLAAATLGQTAAYSVLAGGMIVFCANGYFTYKAFKYHGARSAVAIVQSFWAGQFGKMILTAACFALVFVAIKPLDVAMLFAGYIAVQLTAVTALILNKNG